MTTDTISDLDRIADDPHRLRAVAERLRVQLSWEQSRELPDPTLTVNLIREEIVHDVDLAE